MVRLGKRSVLPLRWVVAGLIFVAYCFACLDGVSAYQDPLVVGWATLATAKGPGKVRIQAFTVTRAWRVRFSRLPMPTPPGGNTPTSGNDFRARAWRVPIELERPTTALEGAGRSGPLEEGILYRRGDDGSDQIVTRWPRGIVSAYRRDAGTFWIEVSGSNRWEVVVEEQR